MATVSRQSAFWAVVALGLNTFVQPGGKVLGLPAQYSRALRLSPIVCITDTLHVLFSVAFFCFRTRSFKDGFTLAARYRRLTEEDPAEPKLERTWWFRFSVFAFGALPQAVKLLAMGGIPLTKIWGMAYLVSFLVLEGLDLLQPRQHRDDHILERHVAVLNRGKRLPGFLAVLAQVFSFMLELNFIPSTFIFKCDTKRRNAPPLPEFGRVMNALIVMIVSMALLAFLTVPPSFFTFYFLFSHHVKMIQRCLFLLVVTAYLVGLGILFGGAKSTCLNTMVDLSLVPLVLFYTFFAWVFLCQDTAFKSRWFREVSGVKPSKRWETSISLLFAAGNIASIICYYMFIYDPSDTYKPPWTENLG